MSDSDSRARVVDHFSGRSRRADVWRGFDCFLDTGAYLNLGYSRWYQPHVLGSPQRRLAAELGRELATRLPTTDGVRLLDVGCGRGGPTLYLADRFGFDVVGVDLVPYNVTTARANATALDVAAAFVVGDATRLPLASGSVAACTAVDSLVYVPERATVFEELSRVVRPGGPVVASDLVAADDLSRDELATLDAFSEAWDMSRPVTLGATRDAMERAGLAVESVTDASAHSIRRFGKWARLFLALVASAGPAVERVLDYWGLDASAVTEQIRTARAALPHLRHVHLVARA